MVCRAIMVTRIKIKEKHYLLPKVQWDVSTFSHQAANATSCIKSILLNCPRCFMLCAQVCIICGILLYSLLSFCNFHLFLWEFCTICCHFWTIWIIPFRFKKFSYLWINIPCINTQGQTRIDCGEDLKTGSLSWKCQLVQELHSYFLRLELIVAKT